MKDNNYPIYQIPSIDHAVAEGILNCDNCRSRKTCHDIYPIVFPDLEKKCGANFTFRGQCYHYTLEDINYDLKHK